MAKRIVDLSAILSELRARRERNSEVSDVLTRLEIGAIDLSDVTSAKIAQLVQCVPKTDRHFSFARTNSLYYVLSHATFANVSADRLDVLRSALRHFKRYASDTAEDNASRTGPLSNAAITDTLESLIAELMIVKDWFVSSQDRDVVYNGSESKRKGDRNNGIGPLRVMLNRIETVTTLTRPLINCRAVAELVDELYHVALDWVESKFQYDDFISASDGPLDSILKMYQFHAHGTCKGSDAQSRFVQRIRDNRTLIESVTVPDLEGGQQIGSEFVRKLSYAISTERLSQYDSPRLAFPILSTSVSILDTMRVENVFFHPGLVYRLLNTPTHSDADESRVKSVIDFCGRVSDRLFRQSGNVSDGTSLSMIADRTRELAMLGFNVETSRVYIRMSLTRSAATGPESKSDVVAELVQQLLMITYNAYMFFLCLKCYSPTFLFHHRRKLILDQQRSVLVGRHDDLKTIWDNAALNINRFFRVWFSEDEFVSQTNGLDKDAKAYLYRDLLNKWGDVLFGSPPSGDSESKHANVPQLTIKDITETCINFRADPEGTSYELLVSMSRHPEFQERFLNLVIVPQFQEIMESSHTVFKNTGHHTLARLIHICRLLVPGEHDLYHTIVSLYNLMFYTTEITGGVFKHIHSLAHSVARLLETAAHERFALKTNLLSEMLVESLIHTVRETVAPVTEDLMTHYTESMMAYVAHARRCYAVSLTECRFQVKTATITLRFDGREVGNISLRSFVTGCRSLVRRHDTFHEKLETIRTSLDRLGAHLRHISTEAGAFDEYASTHPTVKKCQRFLNRVTKTVKGMETSFTETMATSERATKIIVAAADRFLRVIDVLDANRLKIGGPADCIAEAVGLINSSGNAPRPVSHDGVLTAEDVMGHVRDLFPTIAGDEQPVEKQMSSEVDTFINRLEYKNLFEYRLAPLRDARVLRGWYVASTSRAEKDLAGPFSERPDRLLVAGAASKS